MKPWKSASADEESNISAERLQLALRASNEGIWDWWTGHRDIYYSRRILEFLECGENRAPNLFFEPFEHIHPEDQPAFRRALQQALGSGGPEILAVDARVRTGGGSWRWLRVRGTVVRDREGHCLRIAGSMIDISQRKQAEAQVEEERFQLRNLIDRVPLQIYFKNERSEMVMVNRQMADWHGVESTEELIGKHDRDLFDEEHWRAAEADEREIMSSGVPVTSKLEQETWNSREETWVITSKFPWQDRSGRILGTFGVSSDVTQLVRTRQEATRLADELRRRNEVYEEERQLAREIHPAISSRSLPELHVAGGAVARFGARYIPISGLAGDFYEVIEIRPDCVGLLVCDVMGHGVRSALVVAMLRGLLEKQRGLAASPAPFLGGLNEGLTAMLRRAGASMFATAIYCVVDFGAGTLRYACAGHPGPVTSGAAGTKRLATLRCEKGPGLGLFENALYPETCMPLEGIGRLLLFTDGVLEAENPSGEPFLGERLMEMVAASGSMDLESLLDGILERVLSFSESRHFDDDVCLLAMDMRG